MKTFTAILVLATATAALASCPNMCSGHGRCNEFDKCECFKYDGTSKDRRVMWTGADCSQRTCPYDIAFSDISTTSRMTYMSSGQSNIVALKPQTAFDGTPRSTTTFSSYLRVDAADYKLGESKTFNVRVYAVDTTAKMVSLQWKLAEQDTYSRVFKVPYTGVAGTVGKTGIDGAVELGRDYGTTATGCFGAPCPGSLDVSGLGATGVRVYVDAALVEANIAENNLYTFTVDYVDGKPYMAGNADSSHQEQECAGKGLCNRDSGRCECFNGYEGEACQRTSCPNDCSGHGVCQSESRFVADVGNTALTYKNRANGGAYDADKEFGCLCDVGYRGADCSQMECPSGADPLGGAGSLGLDSDWNVANALDCSGRGLCDYSTGTCQCFKGYMGERCETQTVFV